MDKADQDLIIGITEALNRLSDVAESLTSSNDRLTSVTNDLCGLMEEGLGYEKLEDAEFTGKPN